MLRPKIPHHADAHRHRHPATTAAADPGRPAPRPAACPGAAPPARPARPDHRPAARRLVPARRGRRRYCRRARRRRRPGLDAPRRRRSRGASGSPLWPPVGPPPPARPAQTPHPAAAEGQPGPASSRHRLTRRRLGPARRLPRPPPGHRSPRPADRPPYPRRMDRPALQRLITRTTARARPPARPGRLQGHQRHTRTRRRGRRPHRHRRTADRLVRPDGIAPARRRVHASSPPAAPPDSRSPLCATRPYAASAAGLCLGRQLPHAICPCALTDALRS